MNEKNKVILIVESRGEVILGLRDLVASAGYRPMAAMGREEALALLTSLPPDALLLGQLEPGDDVELRAAARVTGVRVIAAPPDRAELPARLEALFSPVDAPRAAPVKNEQAGSGMVTKLLDELAVALADEISDGDDLLSFRLPAAQNPETQESTQESQRVANVATSPGRRLALVPAEEDKLAEIHRELHVSDDFKSPLGSDGVTQILGALAQSLEEPDNQTPRRTAEPPLPTPAAPLMSSEASSHTEPSAPDLSASLFDLAVGEGVKKDAVPIVTRVARPTAGNTPPPEAGSGEEEGPIKSALFTPISDLQGSPTPPPQGQAKKASPKEEPPPLPWITPLPPPKSSPPPRPVPEALEFLLPLRPEKASSPAQDDREKSARLLANAKLLHALFLEQKTGVLTSKSPGGERSLEISGGVLSRTCSNVPDDHIATLLYREGKLTRAQWEEGLSLGERSAEEVVQELLRRGFARRGELQAILERQREEILAGLLEGECSFRQTFEVEEAPLGPAGVPYHPNPALPARSGVFEQVLGIPPLSQLLVDGVRRRLGAADARALLSRATFARASCPSCSLEALSLAPEELSFLSQLDGSRPVEDLLSRELSEEIALPLLLALEVLGLLRVVGRGEPEDGLEDEHRIDRARIESKFEEVLLCDYFELLGVSRRATLYEIRKAYRALTKAFHPDRFRDPYFADLIPRIEEIQEILEDALAVLSDDATRQAYQANLTSE